MAKNRDSFYFETFTACAEISCQAGHMLVGILRDFRPEKLEEYLDEMHKISFISQRMIINKLSETANTISTHLSLATVSIKHTHLKVVMPGLERGADFGHDPGRKQRGREDHGIPGAVSDSLYLRRLSSAG